MEVVNDKEVKLKRRHKIWGWVALIGWVVTLLPFILFELALTYTHSMGSDAFLFVFLPVLPFSILMAFVGTIVWLLTL
jgi:hypothetical protein